MTLVTKTVVAACALSLAGLTALALAQTGPQADVEATRARLKALGSRAVPAHDPSTVVRCGDEYWFFATGNGLPSYHSKDLVSWTPGPPIFEKRPAWVEATVPAHRGIGFWAPDVAKVGDRYLVYYSASTFGKNASGIGLVWNKTLDPTAPDFEWHDEGLVVASKGGGDFNAIDPAVLDDGRKGLWLTFGSFWSGIKIVRLDPKTGKRQGDAMKGLAYHGTIEAPYVYKHKGSYYLFVNWGFCCRGDDSTYEIRVGRSDRPDGPYLDRSGRDLMKDGGTPFFATDGPMNGPGHAGIVTKNGKEWLGFHFYDPTNRGRGTYGTRPLKWDAGGWPTL